MRINVGKTDRKIRLFTGIIVLGVSFTALTGMIKTVSLIVGSMLILTAIIRVCLPYYLFGINTCEKD